MRTLAAAAVLVVWLGLGLAVQRSHGSPLVLGAYALATAGATLAIAWSRRWLCGGERSIACILSIAALMTAGAVSVYTRVMAPFVSFRGFDLDPLQLLMILAVGLFVMAVAADLLHTLGSAPGDGGKAGLPAGGGILVPVLLAGVWPGPMAFWPRQTLVIVAMSCCCGAAIALLASIHGRILGTPHLRRRLLLVSVCLPLAYLGLLAGLPRVLAFDVFQPIDPLSVAFGGALVGGHLALYWLATRLGMARPARATPAH